MIELRGEMSWRVPRNRTLSSQVFVLERDAEKPGKLHACQKRPCQFAVTVNPGNSQSSSQ